MRRLGFTAFGLLILAVFAVAALACAEIGGVGGWVMAAACVAFGVWAPVVCSAVASSGSRPLFVRRGGVGVDNSLPAALMYLALFVILLLLAAGLVIVWAGGGSRPIAAAGPMVALLGAVALALPLIVGLARGRYRRGGLEVTPDGVTYTDFLQRQSLAWDDITYVSAGSQANQVLVHAESPPQTVGPEPRWWERMAGYRNPAGIVIPLLFLRTDQDSLLRWLDHYREHPRDRAELAGRAALDRLDRMRAEA